MKEVLIVILDEFADWEAASLAAALNQAPETEGAEQKYLVKTVSLTKEPVRSIGGFTVLPDYDLASVKDGYAGVILIGGNSWRKEASGQVMQLVQKALDSKLVLGAICDATVFAGKNGLLNDIDHTSNQLEELKDWAGSDYTGETQYLHQQVVRSGNVITANGTAFLEFGKEVLLALDAFPQEEIEEWYQVFKVGYHEYVKQVSGENSPK
ncbi:DJ-1/PfpI family protein [Planococcus sp. N028]|uniref:DJ-1/PfpI family protein n=1 Tax=Planococcus shixiaomingii TaxID=3058393 RepID=A0ABT8N3P6_9BACL|nr:MULTISPECIES: DJ-1/PfpI family protein [unclassified Planococcus (in: firmicutes)]MDN7242506.1 DJ-1/PfpI family protein [Planococcus sp. N028]WKA54740.1 DJ-1/PfpI family protein [Planococcus sp. N022]